MSDDELPPFDLKALLKPLHGKKFPTYRDLRPKLDAIWLKYLRTLGADYGPSDMYRVARENGWIREVEEGHLMFDIPEKG